MATKKSRKRSASKKKSGSLVTVQGKKVRCSKHRVSAFGKRKKVTRVYCGNP